MDRLVGEGAGRAGGHALAARDAGRRAHRVVEVEGDPGGVALAAAADHVVALQVVAGAHAAVAEDAGVVVDRDHRVGRVGAPAGPGRQLAGGDAVAVGQGQQQVVAGRGLLRVVLRRRLVGEQQLGQGGPAALDVVGRRGDRHAVLARPHAGRGEHPAADVDHAHPADPDRVHPLVVAEHRDVDAGVARGGPDRRARGHRQGLAVDGDRDRRGVGRRRSSRGHVVTLTRRTPACPLCSWGSRSGPDPGRPSSRRPWPAAARG